jgi:CheY-like chemotaxis protein
MIFASAIRNWLKEDGVKPRVLIFEDNEILRTTLKSILDGLDYEVHVFADPSMCPQFYASNHSCRLNDSCSDIIISDVNMPIENGLDFIENRLRKGCKVKFWALMSADWNESDLQYAKKLGCKVFRKPFDLVELLDWLNDCRRQIDHSRMLIDWPDGEEKE